MMTWTSAVGQMGVLTIRNVDDDVIVALKARAKANHRSLEGELRHLLARAATVYPTLGVVRERARVANAYAAAPATRRAASDGAEQTADVDVAAPVGTDEWFGAMRDVGEIVGDIVSPAVDPSDWAALEAEDADPKDDPTQ